MISYKPVTILSLLSIGKLSVEKALDLTLYLKNETEIMPVFQGLNELIPMYKLMEKRDMNEVETQFKVMPEINQIAKV